MADAPEKGGITPEPKRDDYDAHSDKPAPTALLLRAELTIPADLISRSESERAKQYRLDVWMFRVQILTLIAIAIYTGIAYHQWTQMREATRAARDGNNLTRQYISTSDGALFFFDAMHVGYTSRTVRLSFRNEGRVAAKDVTGEILIGSVITSNGVFTPLDHFTFGGPGTIVEAGFPHYEWTEMELPTFSPNPPPPYDSPTLPVVKATLSFDNGFGDVRTQAFCNYFWDDNWIECSGLDALIKSKRPKGKP